MHKYLLYFQDKYFCYLHIEKQDLLHSILKIIVPYYYRLLQLLFRFVLHQLANTVIRILNTYTSSFLQHHLSTRHQDTIKHHFQKNFQNHQKIYHCLCRHFFFYHLLLSYVHQLLVQMFPQFLAVTAGSFLADCADQAANSSAPASPMAPFSASPMRTQLS